MNIPLDRLWLAYELPVALQESQAIFPVMINIPLFRIKPHEKSTTREPKDRRTVNISATNRTKRYTNSERQAPQRKLVLLWTLSNRIHLIHVTYKDKQYGETHKLLEDLNDKQKYCTNIHLKIHWHTAWQWPQSKQLITFSKVGFTNISPDGVLVTSSGARLSLCWSSALTCDRQKV